jgi:arylsulfatase A-like enzyme
MGLALGSLGAAGAPPGAGASGTTRPCVVLITVESLRADHLGCYTDGSRPTPAIDRLAARGLRFERAYAASPSTAPSVATILTGLLPRHHGLRHDLTAFLSPGAALLSEQLRRAGYRTGAVVGSFRLDHDRGLSRGFDLYDDQIEGLVKLVLGRSKERRAGEVIRRGLEFLDAGKKGAPFFLWLDLYDPHFDYAPDDPFQKAYPEDPYQGEVASVDASIGALVDGLRSRGLEGKTDLILVGSHGEGLGSHGETGHGVYLFETTIRVPLIVAPASARAPKGSDGEIERRAGRVVRAPVSLADLAPTVLERSGIKPTEGLDGRSLAPVIAGSEPASGRRIAIEAEAPENDYGWSPLSALIEDDHKVVVGARAEAFDLKLDPAESHPLTPPPAWAAILEREARGKLPSAQPPAALRRQVDPMMKGLALPWRDRPYCQEKESRPDPRDKVALNDPLFRARVQFDQGIVGRAIRLVTDDVLPFDPANFTGLDLAVSFALRTGDKGGFQEDLALLQCDYPMRPEPYHHLAHYLEARGDARNAEAAFKITALLAPRSEEPVYDLAALYASQKKTALALDYLQKAIERGATDFAFILKDPHFQGLRKDPGFVHLVGREPAGTSKRAPRGGRR